MRNRGMSYSQIKKELNVSKSSLSLWLRGQPLSEARIRELRNHNEARIEKCRETKARKKTARLLNVFTKVSSDIGVMTDREVFLCGLFLYWGEGGKTQYTRVSLSNTDPAAVLFFKHWLGLLGVPDERLKVVLHLYKDMDPEEEIQYWMEVLELPREAFRKPYIKTSRRAYLTYAQKFTHGTCNVIYEGRDIAEYVHLSMKYLQEGLLPQQTKCDSIQERP